MNFRLQSTYQLGNKQPTYFNANQSIIMASKFQQKLYCTCMYCKIIQNTYLEFKSQLAGLGIDPGVRGLGSKEFGL